MARPERQPLEIPAAAGAGKHVTVFQWRDKTVQVSGLFVGALQVEGSIDGEDFTAIGAPLTGPGFVLVPHAVAFVRLHTNELTSGEPKAAIAGFDYRTL
jgi:hypothetical protein